MIQPWRYFYWCKTESLLLLSRISRTLCLTPVVLVLVASASLSATPITVSNILTLNVNSDNAVTQVCYDSTRKRIYVVGGFGHTLNVGALSATSRGDLDGYVLALTDRLEPLWLVQFGGSARDEATCAVTVGERGIVVGGYCGSNAANLPFYTIGSVTYSGRGNADAVLMLVDTSGHIVWSRNDGGESSDNVTGVTTLADGSIIATGKFLGTTRIDSNVFHASSGLQHAYTQKLTPNGIQTWAHSIISSTTTNRGSAEFVGVTQGNASAIYLPLRYSGSVEWFGAMISDGDLTDYQQHVLVLDPDGKPLPEILLSGCNIGSSVWDYHSHSGRNVWQEQAELCGDFVPPAVYTLSISDTVKAKIGHGTLHINAVQEQFGRVLYVGSVAGGIVLNTPGNTTYAPTVGATAAICILADYNGLPTGFIGIEASEDAQALDAVVTQPGFVVAIQAGGKLAGYPEAGMLTHDHRIIATVSTTSGIESAPTVALPGNHHDDLYCGEPAQFFRLTGEYVLSSTLAEAASSLVPGLYVVRCRHGLFLRYASAQHLYKIVSTATSW